MEVADEGKIQSQLSPEIERYLAMWERDPKSRVFAPLAEAYRKIGELDRAIEICEKGLTIHPNYVSGRVALGRAYFERGNFASAKTQLEIVFEADPGNLVAAKTLGEIYEEEEEYEKALLCYRLAHYATPSAVEIVEKISSMEAILADSSASTEDIDDITSNDSEDAEALTSSLQSARAALRKSEAIAAGEIIADEEEVEKDFQEESDRLSHMPDVFKSQEEDDEITLEMDSFFTEAPTETKGDIVGFQVRHPSDSIVAEGRERNDEYSKLTMAEILLRTGKLERAISVYSEFLQADPGNEQAASRLDELKKQLEDLNYEIRIRAGEPDRQVREEEDRKEVVYTLVDWLQKVKIESGEEGDAA